MAKQFQQNPIGITEMPSITDRQIYNNAIALPLDQKFTAAQNSYAPQQNVRKATKRKVKTTNVVAVMIFGAGIALLYISNVIAVNNLAKEINDLSIRHNQIVSMNEMLKAEINRKSSLDRISLLAQEQLGMMNPKEAPTFFEVNKEKELELQGK